MMTRSGWISIVAFLLLLGATLVGCTEARPGAGTVRPGEACYLDADCIRGASCVDRICRNSPTHKDPGDAGLDAIQEDSGAGDIRQQDIGEGGDSGEGGTKNDATTADALLDIGTQPDAGAPDASQPDTSPEDTFVDPGTCCENGCGAGMFCSGCECRPIDANRCNFQDQPCSEEGINNGFICTSIEDGAPLRCLGLCNRDAADPNATCPAAGSVCAFDVDNVGVCLSGCDLDQGCGLSGYGCLPISDDDHEGVCTPTNDTNELGDRCDPEKFFDCEEGAFCLDRGNGQGRCVAGCGAFSHLSSGETDCDEGHCVAITSTLGMCRPDTSARVGQRCRPRDELKACGEDAVMCVRGQNYAAPYRCLRTCRVRKGDQDCGAHSSCIQVSPSDEIGICLSFGAP